MENEPHDRACSTKPKRKHPRDERRDKRTIFVPLSADAVEAVRRCQRGARLFPGRLVMVRGPALSAVANGWLRSRGGEVTRRSIVGHPSSTCAPQNIVTIIPHRCFPILSPPLQQVEYDAIDNSFQLRVRCSPISSGSIVYLSISQPYFATYWAQSAAGTVD